MKANSLTTDSKATAATIPSWRSVASRWRVPNQMVNRARMMAIRKVVSSHHGNKSFPACANNTARLAEMAFSCKAI
ncbi:hypothetical protein D3C86_2159240 [compost metagenome]